MTARELSIRNASALPGGAAHRRQARLPSIPWRIVIVAWLLATSDLMGLVNHSETSELVFGILTAAIGAVCGALGLLRPRPHSSVRRIAARAPLVLLAFTLYACVLARWKWGGFAYGELARSLSFGVFTYLAASANREVLLAYWRRALRALAYASALIVFVHAATGMNPPGYEPVVPGSPLEGLHIVPSTILLTALVSELLSVSSRIRWIHVAFFFAAQLLEGHASLAMCASLVVFITVLFKAGERPRDTKRSRLRKLTLWAASAGSVAAALWYLGVVDQFLHSDAFLSRIAISERRIDDLTKHIWFGVGAPGRTASISLDYQADAISRFTDTVRVVDFGYVDLLLRYGLVAGILYLLFWVYTALAIARNVRSWQFVCYPALVGAFLLVNVTLSVFTVRDGLFTLMTVLTLTTCHIHDNRSPLPHRR